MLDNQFFIDVELYVFNLYKNKLSSKVVYHNFIHTKSVVDVAIEILEAEKISEADSNIVKLSAWFHDIGFVEDFKNHEEKSKKIAKKYLLDKGVDVSIIKEVNKLIEVTKISQKPTTLLEEIICDADLYHIGTKSFSEKTDLLRAEWELLCNTYLTDLEWFKENDEFLTNHKYFTNYAFNKLHKQKTSNWLKVKSNLRKLTAKKEEQDSKTKVKNADLKRKKDKEKISERGIETMYRVAFKNHIKLSAIADAKAHILLSVSAIVVSIVISRIFPKLDKADNYFLIIPTVVFLLVAIITMIYSVISTLPKISTGTFTKEDVVNKKVNLLFFGNFHQMPLKDFQKGMTEIMKDKDYLYNSLMKDLYFLGIVLSRKYKLLRIAYIIFMVGFVISVFVFIISLEIMKNGGWATVFNLL